MQVNNNQQSMEPISLSTRIKTYIKIFKENVLIIFPIVVLFILFGTTIILEIKYRNTNGDICLSKDCVRTAMRVMDAMDSTAKPCENFYQFACGKWISTNRVPSHLPTFDRMISLRENIARELQKILEEDINKTFVVPESVIKAKTLYKMCMDTKTLEKKGKYPIYGVLQTVGLPIQPPTNESSKDFNWLYTIVKAKRFLGLDLLVKAHVSEDVRNTSINKLIISQVSPGFKDVYLYDPKNFSNEIKTFKKYTESMLKEYNPSFPNATGFADDVLNFMIKLARVMTDAKTRRSPSHLFYDIKLSDLARGPNGSATWTYFNWNRYLNMLFNGTSVVLKPQDMAIVTDLDYLKNLSYILKTTDKVIIEKFLWWRVFLAVSPLTRSEFTSLEHRLSQGLLGTVQPQSRNKKCTLSVNNNFGLALGYMYMFSRYNKTERKRAMDMLENIRDAFEKDVKKSDWMDQSTREKTIIKIQAIKSFVGFPDWILNGTGIDNFYKNVSVIDGDLAGTYLNLTFHTVKMNLESLRSSPKTNRWPVPTNVNAYYAVSRNFVSVPAGILQPPFFGNALESIDYGSIGAIMGHEITHGFDDQGRKYDEKGNLKQWWTNETLQEYYKKVKCIIEQYSQYYLPELGPSLHVDGYNTQGENIADNGGIRAAFEGYRQYAIDTSKIQRRLPGLTDFTPEQLFFLGYAQVWCGNGTLKAMKDWVLGAVHSPNRVRVIGTLSNYEEFSKAWNCPVGSPMNPAKKCAVW